MADLIERQIAIDAIKTWGLIDGLSEGQAIEILSDENKVPSAEPEAISRWKKEFKEYVDSLDIARDDWKGIIEYIDELPSAQLGTNLAEVGTDLATKRTVKGFPIDADLLMLIAEEKYGCRARDRLYEIIRYMPKYELPPVQPDIIRCKDCAFCDSDVVDVPYGITKKVWWCDRFYAGANENLIVEPDDFCSFAKRRE